MNAPMNSFTNHLHDRVCLFEDVVVPEAQHGVAAGFEKRGAAQILFFHIRMLPTVRFDDHAR